MKKLFLYILPFCLLVNSCKKNPLPPGDSVSESPAFYFKCDIQGAPLKLEAGVNDYYMFSSHQQDANNVYNYVADLKPKNCVSCGWGLSISINDYKVSFQNETMKPDSGLFIGAHEFNDGNLPSLGYYVSFSPLMDGTTNTFVWNYNNGAGQIPLQNNNHFFKPGTYSVTLNAGNTFCNDVHTNVFKVGSLLQTNVIVVKESVTQLSYRFSASPTMSNVAYLWDFADGTTSTTPKPIHAFNTPGDYITTLRLIGGNDTCYSYYKVRAWYNEQCNANYSNLFSEVPNTNALSAITIRVTDPSTGIVYSSGTINQATGSKIEIVSVSDYKNNEAGNKTKMVKLRFNCTVTDASNSTTLNVTNGEAVIAVSYK